MPHLALKAFAMLATIFVTACASAPGSIAPVQVSPARYGALNCTALLTEQVRVSEALREASDKQSATASGDAMGVLLIGLPISSMTGNDNEGRVAQFKGESDALRLAVAAKGCATVR